MGHLGNHVIQLYRKFAKSGIGSEKCAQQGSIRIQVLKVKVVAL